MKLRILSVEDNPGDQKLLEEAFNEMHFECDLIRARSGREAIQLAVINKPDIILIDIIMPDLSGGETVRIIKQNFQTRDIPVIFVSAVIDRKEEGTEQGILINGERYPSLAKPVDPQKLVDLINASIAGY